MVSDEHACGPYVAKPLFLTPFAAVMLAPARVGDPASMRAFARPYRDVSRRLTEWIGQGLAHEDTTPAIYVHEYTSGGLSVRGIVATLDFSHRTRGLTERALWPHEAVHDDQADELAARMLEMRINPAPILLAHAGNRATRAWVANAVAGVPDFAFTDRAGQHHRIWAVRSHKAHAALNLALVDTQCLIADGHHRYAAYRRLQESRPGTGWDLGLTMLIDQTESPLHLGALHRALDGVSLRQAETAARAAGATIERLTKGAALNRLGRDTLLLSDGTDWLTVDVTLTGPGSVVEWLHDELIAAHLSPAATTYHHDLDSALDAASARCTAAVLPTTTFESVIRSVQEGRLLPEKATSFQPKPNVGVLMRRVHDAPPAPH